MVSQITAQSWKLARSDALKKFDSLMREDFAQLRFVTIDGTPVSEDLWVKVKEFVVGRGEYWAVLDDVPELINDMPLGCEVMFKACHVVDCIAHDRDDIALVDFWGTDWGWYKRSEESDFPIQCSFGQIQDKGDFGVLGDGCYRGKTAIRQFNKGISYKSKRKQVQKFDEAWKAISEHSREVLFVHYVVEAALMEKVAALDITVHEYFPALRIAQEEILGKIVTSGAA